MEIIELVAGVLGFSNQATLWGAVSLICGNVLFLNWVGLLVSVSDSKP